MRSVPVTANSSGTRGERDDQAGWWLAWGAGMIAVLVAIVSIKAWLAGTNDPDSMASVLYFQRIAGGQHLEVTVLTTPKPLLTVLYGLSWNLTHDWRAPVWETIAIHGLGVAVATRVATRLAGLAAGVFLAAALITSSTELAEVAQANSLPWAFAGWSIAAWAITSRPRRFGLAGVALALSGMARIESWLIIGLATAALVVLALPFVRRASWPAPRSTLPFLIGWLAIPVQLLHDALLTGDPWYWLHVPSAYTAFVAPRLAPMRPLGFARDLLDRYSAGPWIWIVLLAAIGFAYLVLRRHWPVVAGLIALIPGVLLLLASLALRGVFIADRYYEQPNIGLLFAAAIGVGALSEPVFRFPPARLGSLPRIGARLAALLVALLLFLPGPLTPDLARRTARLQAASADLEQVMPRLRTISSDAVGQVPPSIPGPAGFTKVNPRTATLVVPRPLQRRISVELNVPLTRLADSLEAFRAQPAADLLVAGQFVYHDARLDAPPNLFTYLEIASPTELGDHMLVPIVVLPHRSWLLAVEP